MFSQHTFDNFPFYGFPRLLERAQGSRWPQELIQGLERSGVLPSAMMTARRTHFASSRTFPGQE